MPPGRQAEEPEIDRLLQDVPAASLTDMALTIDEFVSVARESKLVSPALLDSMLGEVEAMGQSHDTHALASKLIGRGALTNWQSEKLMSGVSSGFFLGKYKLQRLIASGSMSSVYEAEHTLLRKRFALKVLPKALVGEASFLERFYREARAVVRLDHPNIIRGFDVGQEGDYHYFVMEYLEGQSFQDLIERTGPLAPTIAAGLIRQAALGLEHAHQAGMIHRDIKPANLLLAQDGVVKVLDLGLVRSLPHEIEGEAGLTRVHDERMLGTVDYLSPEQAIDSHNVDIRSDVYSLGCTFYFLLTGEPPFAKGTLTERLLAHQTRSAIPISVIRPDVPAALGRILGKMLEKRPDNRYQTPAEIAISIEDWENNLNSAKPQPGVDAVASDLGSSSRVWSAARPRPADGSADALDASASKLSASDTRIRSGSNSRLGSNSSIGRGSSIVRRNERSSSSIVKRRASESGPRIRPAVVINRELWEPWSLWVKAVEVLASGGLRFTPSDEAYQDIYDDLMISCKEILTQTDVVIDDGIKSVIQEIQDITAPWMSLQTLRQILQGEMKGSVVHRIKELDSYIMSSRDPGSIETKPKGVLSKVLMGMAAALILSTAYLFIAPEPTAAEASSSWLAQVRLNVKRQLVSLGEMIASH